MREARKLPRRQHWFAQRLIRRAPEHCIENQRQHGQMRRCASEADGLEIRSDDADATNGQSGQEHHAGLQHLIGWQLKHIESDVDPMLRIGHAERAAVAEAQPGNPTV